MAADYWRRQGVPGDTALRFRTAPPGLFSVAGYVRTLQPVCRRYGIEVGYRTRLVSVDGPRAVATFERQSADGVFARWEERYDLLHAVPPQGPTAAARISALADADGWLDVDPETLQHRRYPNVFGMGDATSVPTSKTAAAVRAQLPVVVANLLAVMADRTPAMHYSGYASCPLITAYGKVVLAEFVYGRTPAPSLPWDSTRERRSASSKCAICRWSPGIDGDRGESARAGSPLRAAGRRQDAPQERRQSSLSSLSGSPIHV